MSRTGSGWDVLAAAAVLAPLAALVGRRPAVPGALAGLAGFVVLLAAGAAPEIGNFAPDPLALAAAAGTLLLAASLEERAPSTAMVLGPAAAAIAFGVGLVDPPDLGSGPATALVMGAAAASAALARGPEPGRLLLPAVLLAGFRGVAELPDPAAAIGLGLAALAMVLVLPARVRGRGRLRGAETAAVALVAVAVAAGPLPAARPAGALLAAAAVLVVAVPPGTAWALVAATPGAAVVATALADVPSPGAPAVGVHLAFAAVLLAVVVGLAVHAERGGAAPWTPARGAAAVLVAWLAVAPGSWTWALPVPELLDAWDRAAAFAAAAGLAAAVALVAAEARRDRFGAEAAR